MYPHFPELRPGPILLPESFCVSPSAPLLGGLSRADLPKHIRFFHTQKYHVDGRFVKEIMERFASFWRGGTPGFH
jgi:hypothetical protein